MEKHDIKKGDIVIVDEKHALGGYEAVVVWAGSLFVRIKTDGEPWDIMKNRVRRKTEES